jgi:hypothetical protein
MSSLQHSVIIAHQLFTRKVSSLRITGAANSSRASLAAVRARNAAAPKLVPAAVAERPQNAGARKLLSMVGFSRDVGADVLYLLAGMCILGENF